MVAKQSHVELTLGKRTLYSYFMKRFAYNFFVLAALGCLWSACTANQTVAIAADGSGTASIRVEIKKLFAEYFVNAEESNKKAEIFDIAKIKKAIEKRSGFAVKKIVTPTPESLEMELSFKDIRTLFDDNGPKDPNGIITLTEKDGQTRLRFHVEKKSARQISSLFSDLSNPAFREMSPRKKRTSSEKEYLDAIQFAVGNEGPALVKSAYVEITIKVDGNIISQSGGAIVNGAAVFHVPLLRMMLMEKPLDYSVTFSKAHKTGQKRSPKAK